MSPQMDYFKLAVGLARAEGEATLKRAAAKATPISDMPGKRFGRWTVVAFFKRTTKTTIWSCRCDCGAERNVPRGRLIDGSSLSCGCYARELTSARSKKHGMHGSPEYLAWQQLKKRCLNPMDKDYKNYGGRGISVCDEWKNSFAIFLSDMGARPSDGHSIDRIDTDGNYEPTNCRWATKSQQQINRRLLPSNTTGVPGVFFVKSDSLWRAVIGHKYLGSFKNIFDAFCARKAAEITYDSYALMLDSFLEMKKQRNELRKATGGGECPGLPVRYTTDPRPSWMAEEAALFDNAEARAINSKAL